MSTGDFDDHSYGCKDKCHYHPYYDIEIAVIKSMEFFSPGSVLHGHLLDKITDKGYQPGQVDYKKYCQKVHHAGILPQTFKYVAVI